MVIHTEYNHDDQTERPNVVSKIENKNKYNEVIQICPHR